MTLYPQQPVLVGPPGPWIAIKRVALFCPARRLTGMRDSLPVFGGPMDGETMPACGPDGYHYEFNGKHYWYFRQGCKWTLAFVNDGAVPKRPATDAMSTRD